MKNILFLLAFTAGNLLLPSLCGAQTPTDKQVQAIENLMAPQRQKVLAVLEADPTGQYKTYKADLETIAKEKDPARKEELAQKLERDHLEFIRKAYAKANINTAELRKQVAKILGHNNFRFGEFADIQIDVTLPAAALPVRFDETLLCPFDVQDESDNNMVASQCDAEAFDCSIAVESLAEIAGGCRSKADVGGKMELPEGTFNNITVVTQTDISYKGWAFAVAGYAQINAKFGIRFRAPGVDKTVMTKEVFAMAPVIWFSYVHGDQDNFTAQASFSGTFSGGASITAQVHTEVFALSVPVLTITEMDANTLNIDSIRISGSN